MLWSHTQFASLHRIVILPGNLFNIQHLNIRELRAQPGSPSGGAHLYSRADLRGALGAQKHLPVASLLSDSPPPRFSDLLQSLELLPLEAPVFRPQLHHSRCACAEGQQHWQRLPCFELDPESCWQPVTRRRLRGVWTWSPSPRTACKRAKLACKIARGPGRKLLATPWSLSM